MKIFNKKIVESSVPPVNTNVLWADIDENDKSILTLKKFLNGEWEDIIKREESGNGGDETTTSGVVIVPFNTIKGNTPTDEEISEMINKCGEALAEDKVCIIKCDIDNTSSGGGTYYFYVTGYSSERSSIFRISAIGLPGSVWDMYYSNLDALYILTAFKSNVSATFSIREMGTFESVTNINDYINQSIHSNAPVLLVSETGGTSSGGGTYYYYMIGNYITQVKEGFYFIGADKDNWNSSYPRVDCSLLHIYKERDNTGEPWSDWIIGKQSLIEPVPTLDLTSHLSELESFVPTQNEATMIMMGYMVGELKVILGDLIYKLKACSEVPTGNSGTIKMNNTSIGFDNNKLYISTMMSLELSISEDNQYTLSVTGQATPTQTIIDLSSLV